MQGPSLRALSVSRSSVKPPNGYEQRARSSVAASGHEGGRGERARAALLRECSSDERGRARTEAVQCGSVEEGIGGERGENPPSLREAKQTADTIGGRGDRRERREGHEKREADGRRRRQQSKRARQKANDERIMHSDGWREQKGGGGSEQPGKKRERGTRGGETREA